MFEARRTTKRLRMYAFVFGGACTGRPVAGAVGRVATVARLEAAPKERAVVNWLSGGRRPHAAAQGRATWKACPVQTPVRRSRHVLGPSPASSSGIRTIPSWSLAGSSAG